LQKFEDGGLALRYFGANPFGKNSLGRVDAQTFAVGRQPDIL
jgi:hypothetical protein